MKNLFLWIAVIAVVFLAYARDMAGQHAQNAGFIFLNQAVNNLELPPMNRDLTKFDDSEIPQYLAPIRQPEGAKPKDCPCAKEQTMNQERNMER